MNKIRRFVDFLTESESNYSNLFTEKDRENISDLFLEIADKYNLREIGEEKSFLDVISVFDNNFKTKMGIDNQYIGLNISIEYDMYPKIDKEIMNDFVSMLEKWGYYIYLRTEDSIFISPRTHKEIKRLYYIFRKGPKQ